MRQDLETAKDQLWKFKLQREHAQLLQDIDTHKEIFTTFAEEAKAAQKQLQDQISVLKFRFESLADENKKQTLEAENYQRLVDNKIAEIDSIKARLKALGVQVEGLEHGQTTLAQPIASPMPSTPVPATAPEMSSSSPPSIALPLPAQVSRPSTIPPSSSSSSSAPASPDPTTTTAHTSSRKPPRHHLHPPQRRSQRIAQASASAGSGSGSGSVQPATNYARFPSPPIQQGSRSIAEYVAAVDAVSAAIDPELRTAVAAMFVTGLAEREVQDTVVCELERRGLAKVHRGGSRQVEMRCVWGEVRGLLSELGLLVLGTGEDEDEEGSV